MNRREVLQGMGAAMMSSAASGLRRRAPSRMWCMNSGCITRWKGKLDALVARFRDHTDADI